MASTRSNGVFPYIVSVIGGMLLENQPWVISQVSKQLKRHHTLLVLVRNFFRKVILSILPVRVLQRYYIVSLFLPTVHLLCPGQFENLKWKKNVALNILNASSSKREHALPTHRMFFCCKSCFPPNGSIKPFTGW